MQLDVGYRGWRWGAIAAAVAGTLGFAVARPAQASCLGEPLGLLWSYPANGAQEVPIDADLFVNGLLNGQPSLAGEPLPRIAPGVYDLGQLEPQTRYEVRWDDAALVFTTGSEASFPPGEPEPDVRVTRNPIDFRSCPLVPAQGCFDTGEPTVVRFAAGAARAWLVDVSNCDGSVRQMLWPSACGVPVVESEDRIVCVSLRATQGAGFSESTDVICSVPDVPLETIPRSSGCVGAWPPEDALTLAADDAVTLGSLSGPVAASRDPDPVAPAGNQPSRDVAAAPSAPAAGCTLAATANRRAPAALGGMLSAAVAALITLRRQRAKRQR